MNYEPAARDRSPSPDTAFLPDLEQRVHRFIITAYAPDGPAERFAALLEDILSAQRTLNPVYRRLCECVGGWPYVHTDVFKYHDVACFPVSADTPYFQTSGTTAEVRGRKYYRTDALYAASALTHFARRFPLDDAPCFSLFPPIPSSSLAHMVALLTRWRPGGYLYRLSGTYDVAAIARMGELARQRPVILFATRRGLRDFMATFGTCPLNEASWVIDTGGDKGMADPPPPDVFERLVYDCFGPVQRAGEYGMTELFSQCYARLGDDGQYHWSPPPWCRVDVLAPRTLAPCPPGQRGMVAFTDLANVETAVKVLTSDTGELCEDGTFLLHGRPTTVTDRGCSLLC
jgi:hypothetical protein